MVVCSIGKVKLAASHVFKSQPAMLLESSVPEADAHILCGHLQTPRMQQGIQWIIYW